MLCWCRFSWRAFVSESLRGRVCASCLPFVVVVGGNNELFCSDTKSRPLLCSAVCIVWWQFTTQEITYFIMFPSHHKLHALHQEITAGFSHAQQNFMPTSLLPTEPPMQINCIRLYWVPTISRRPLPERQDHRIFEPSTPKKLGRYRRLLHWFPEILPLIPQKTNSLSFSHQLMHEYYYQ